MARRSARLSKRASVNFNESNILDPDTNVIGDGMNIFCCLFNISFLLYLMYVYKT